MAVITPDSFNPLRRYVSVRLQQGVPLVDAEWNEQDDVRRFELRAYLKWFVGDGIPFGSDAFLIEAATVPVANDFVIRSGVGPAPGGTPDIVTGLRHVGRCLVDGLEATIGADLGFRDQAIHVAQPAAAAAAALRGTTTIPELAVLGGSLTVYLDVWDRLVRPDEEPALVYTEIGTETCVRLRREWAVRARDATDVPVPGDPDFEPEHSYYALASVARVVADPIVYPSQVADRREQRLLTPPSTLIDDVLGTSPDRYRRGLDRPAISIRSAVNALLRGELPSSPDQVIAPDPSNDFATRSILEIGPDTAVFWHGNRVGGIDQVLGTSWPTSHPDQAATNAPVQITTAAASATLPSAVVLPTSPQPSVLVAYAADNNISFRRAPTVGGLSAAAEENVSVQVENEESPVAVRVGDIVTFLWYWNGPGTTDRIRFRRRQYQVATWAEATATWLDGETTDLSTLQAENPSTSPGTLHAVPDSAGRIWLAFRTANDRIAVARITPSTGAIENWTDQTFDSGATDEHPFVLVDEPGRIWVFWTGATGLQQATFDLAAGTWQAAAALVPGTAAGDRRPAGLLDQDGGVWLLWTRPVGADTHVFASRRHPETGAWGAPRQVTASAGINDFAYASFREGSIDLFFRSNRGGQFDLYYKQLIIAI
jgi:hypothetical protein